MVNFFKLGSNLDINSIEKVAELNDKYKDRGIVKEWYGSTRKYEATAARPGFRLTEMEDSKFAEFVRKSLDFGIDFNWTMNSIQPYNSKIGMLNHKNEIHEFVQWLEDIGVKRITVTNPMLAKIIREKSSIPFELSTIAHLDTVTQLKIWKDTIGIDKVCMNILHNRDFEFLKNCQKFCNANGIMLDLMTNEFCGNASSQSATHCIFRDSCYLCHATNKTKEDAMAYDNYPMGYCSTSRGMTEVGWLRSRFILPQWIKIYNKETGIHHWKISGRTGTTEYLLNQAEAFLSQKYDKGLIQLWKPLESIWSGKSEEEEAAKYPFIDCNKLTSEGFLSHWIDDDFRCHEHLCGGNPAEDPSYDKEKGFGKYACNYCPTFFAKHLMKK